MNALWPSSSAVGVVDAATVRLLTFVPFRGPSPATESRRASLSADLTESY
jgi:hypothetical protein